jgi:hypothetical protein
MTSYIKNILTVLLLSLLNQFRICFHIYFQLLERKLRTISSLCATELDMNAREHSIMQLIL